MKGWSGTDQRCKTLEVSSQPDEIFVFILLVNRPGWHEVEGPDTLRRLDLGGAGTVFVPDIHDTEIPTLVS